MSQATKINRKEGDHTFEAVHKDDREWEMLRFEGFESKMLFHPRPERPTEPNAGFARFAPGVGYPMHRHDFAQVWYILEGEFLIGGKKYGPGTAVFHPDPHVEDEMYTETGGLWFMVQYPGPTTGGPAIYEGRFNMKERKSLEEERFDV